MTRALILAYNAGVEAVLAIAERSAETIAATSKHHVRADFAVVALAELAEAGRALLQPIHRDPPGATASVDPPPKSPAPSTQTAEAVQ